MRFITILVLMSIFMISCPNPPEETICGQGMVLVNETCECIPNSFPSDDVESCECDTLYHWNDDQSECVLDTSSPYFVWEVYQVGEGGSMIRDVAPTCDLILVTGYIMHNDTIYNHASFDGSDWTYIKFLEDTTLTIINEGRCLFSPNNNLLYSGSHAPIAFDCAEWTLLYKQAAWEVGWEFNSYVLTMNGFGVNDFYLSGSNGSFAHYDGEVFSQVETNSDYHLYDIKKSESLHAVYVLGSNGLSSMVLSYDGENIKPLLHSESIFPDSSETDYGRIWAIDVYQDTLYIASVAGLIKYSLVNDSIAILDWNLIGLPESEISDVIVNHPNDILILKHNGSGSHYNGLQWTQQPSLFDGTDISSPHIYRCRSYNGVVYGIGYSNSNQQGFMVQGTNK